MIRYVSYIPLHTMKNGTKIVATHPNNDRQFLIYALQGENKKVLEMKYSPGHFEYLGSDPEQDVEMTLLYHYIIKRADQYAEFVFWLEELCKIYDRAGDGSMLCSPKQMLIDKIDEMVREEDSNWQKDYPKKFLSALQRMLQKRTSGETLDLLLELKYDVMAINM